MPTQTALTLGQMMDQIRRDIQVVPEFDVDGSTVGQPSASFPDPNNNLLIEDINEAIDEVNSIVRCGKISTITIAVTPATMPGPMMIDFTSAIADTNSVSEVMAVYWQASVPTTSQPLRLTNTKFYDGVPWEMPPDPMSMDNTPQQWFQSGTQLGLIPPPNQAGTLYILQQEGLLYLTNITTDKLSAFFPTPYQRVIIYIAVSLLAGRTSSDVEMQQRGAYFDNRANQMLTQIYNWKNGFGQVGVPAQQQKALMTPELMRQMRGKGNG